MATNILILVKIILVFLFALGTGILYGPIVTDFRDKITSILEKPPKKVKVDKSLLPHDVQCDDYRPKPKFLKTPNLLNASCVRTACVRSKRVRWKMVIFVKSRTRNFVLRELIRRTWASVTTLADAQFQTVFVLGRNDLQNQALIDEEYERYNDILQVDITDVFRNVHEKALAALFWADKNLPADYLYAEADDDILINFALVQLNIHEFRQSSSNRFWPEFPMVCMNQRLSYETPQRNSGDKHFYSKEDFKWPFLPDYCKGGLFACSVRVAGYLWEASRVGNTYEASDVLLTGILRQKIGMPRQMLVEARPFPAIHFHGYSAEKPQYTLVKMQNEWKKIWKDLLQNVICICDRAM